MSQKYLITDIFKKDLKVTNQSVFLDEYLGKLYYKQNHKKNKNYFISIKYYSEIDYTSKYVLNKLDSYRTQLAKKLNILHSESCSIKYWGLILDQFLFLIINQIYIEQKILKKIFLKNKNLIVNKELFTNTYLDSQDFATSRINDNSQAFSRYIIAKDIGFKTRKFARRKIYKHKINSKNSSILKIYRPLIRAYIKFFNPTVLVDCYLGALSTIKIFLMSFGKILPITQNQFFDNKPTACKKNEKQRNELQVKVNDKFDLIFNIFLKKFLPLSYLENYSYYQKFAKKFKSIKKIGTAVHLIYTDEFKFLSAEIIEKKGKLFALPHGGLLGQKKYDYDQIVENRYATKVFRWQDKLPLQHNQLNKLIPFKKENIKKNQQILFYPTRVMTKSNYKIPLFRKYHPYCNSFYDLYDRLNYNLKNNVKIKSFPHYSSKYFQSNWIKIYKKNLFINKNKNLFYNSKIFVIDDYSTPICELIHTETPFIIIDPEEKNLKQDILSMILELKKIDMLFESPIEASNFLNKNFDKIDLWWSTILKSKAYLELKNNLIPNNRKFQSFNKAFI